MAVDEKNFLMDLLDGHYQARRGRGTFSEEVHTQELSETDIMRGANVEVGTFGVVVPLIEGVLRPWQKTRQMSYISRREGILLRAYHEATPVAHRAQRHGSLGKWGHSARGLAVGEVWGGLVWLYGGWRRGRAIDRVQGGIGFVPRYCTIESVVGTI